MAFSACAASELFTTWTEKAVREVSTQNCGSGTIGTQHRAPVVLPPTQLGHIAGKAEVHGHEVDLAESVDVEAAEDGKPAALKHILADSEQLLLEIRQRERLSAHMLALLSEGLEVAQGGGDFLFVLSRQVVDKNGFVWEVGAGSDQRAVESSGPAARDGGGKTAGTEAGFGALEILAFVKGVANVRVFGARCRGERSRADLCAELLLDVGRVVLGRHPDGCGREELGYGSHSLPRYLCVWIDGVAALGSGLNTRSERARLSKKPGERRKRPFKNKRQSPKVFLSRSASRICR